MSAFGNYYFKEGDPHHSVWNCFLSIYHSYLTENEWSAEERFSRLDLSIKNLFDLSGNCRIEYKPQYYERYCISGSWWMDLLYPDHLAGDGGIEEFAKGTKYLALADSSEWNFYDETSSPDFPAVFYSTDEIKAWFVATMKLSIKLMPHYHDELNTIVNKHADAASSIALLKGRLKCDIAWEHGPARNSEPNRYLWQQRTKYMKMNNLTLSWIL